LGSSLSIFPMQKCGLVHPPAGAAAVVFASSPEGISSDLMHCAVFMVADVVVIALAVVFNNFSDTRQYPMYWRLNLFAK